MIVSMERRFRILLSLDLTIFGVRYERDVRRRASAVSIIQPQLEKLQMS